METRITSGGQIKRSVLVVEDEAVNREILGEILKERYSVIFAKDGLEALDLMEQNKGRLSLVLLDLLMPNLDGFGVLERVRADGEFKRLPIIVLTADKAAEIKSLEMGAADFITKPYDMPEVILARVQRIIEFFEDRSVIQAAERDEFTGLYSESFFYEYAGVFDRYNPKKQMDAVVFDIDHFHLVNALYGRSYGDKVLKSLSGFLKSYAEAWNGLAARKKDDIFMLYVPSQKNLDSLKDSLDNALKKDCGSSKVRVRIGFCAQSSEVKVEERFEKARVACNTIRDKYNLSVARYDDESRKKTLFSERLIGDVSDGIEKKQFKVFFQPKFGIQGEKPVLKGAEALVRWEHPEFGLVSPGLFIPLFEDNGLIQIVDKFVWREAASKVRLWKDKYKLSLPVSVNVSRIDIHDLNIEDEIMFIVNHFGLEPKDLHLEITESGYSEDSNRLVEVVRSFRDKGFVIEMDDFGSGYSSLNMHSSLPIDVLKMDMKFVREMQKDEKNFRMVKMIMDIAKFLGVPVVAEGVENEEQYKMLKSSGCDIVQGYYFSKPLPAQDFEAFVKELAQQGDF